MDVQQDSDDENWIIVTLLTKKSGDISSTYVKISPLGHLDQDNETNNKHLNYYFDKSKFLAAAALLNVQETEKNNDKNK